MADGAQSTTEVHRQFVSEPMAQKPVTKLSGIGPISGAKLTEAGYGKAFKVFGQFLVLNKEEERFIEWLKETAGTNTRCAEDCYNCVREWNDKNF